ncbi:hypothetical protein BGC07_06170 [Piscirickettsia litoralis]|uniref:Transmission trait enhancer LetE n=2 Tax=Piscirickettsia litoralis TaxID=1891921 RepID=A0ABX3A4K0_9GAMM|nr:hypothetical protein BGC07_06170 [Piscirickettsia litoralis]
MAEQNVQGELELLLHTQVTDYASEWMSGYEAAQEELPETDNPHDSSDKTAFTAWTEGWWAGFYNEPPLYQKNAPVDTVSAARSQAANENWVESNDEESQEPGFEKALLGVGFAFACVVCYELVVTMVA